MPACIRKFGCIHEPYCTLDAACYSSFKQADVQRYRQYVGAAAPSCLGDEAQEPASANPTPGYHLAVIPRGEYGEASKIVEEALELQDAMGQGCRIMALVELSDLLGAMLKFMEKYYPDFGLADLRTMAEITGRAFTNGQRK